MNTDYFHSPISRMPRVRNNRLPAPAFLLAAAVVLVATGVPAAPTPPAENSAPRIGRVVLEMSPKPLPDMKDDSIRQVCREVFRQWLPLLQHADSVAILLWTADGSEILEYRGRPDDPIEWARFIGIPKPRDPPLGPQKEDLHKGGYFYRKNPPTMTYRDLAKIVKIFKEVGREATGKPIRVGATFDPGPEFAPSPFKYRKHNEICVGSTMGHGTFACCYATLNADPQAYAGFPAGIPQGTPLGTFLGGQCRHFLADEGFDYLWLSNGFGFGMETWKTTGPLFDGQHFDARRAGEIRRKILDFWKCFRAECPGFPIETRGTNLATGIDLASNAVPLGDIYAGGFDMAPPPNSPWAALNGDFGFEMVGYMSHIAELPAGKRFPFRFYVHDPWWLNSPWLDRYGREPHDIYLPLAIGRINGQGQVENPGSVAFLTIDDSYGRMPAKCPNEVIPHILAAWEDLPDRPGPLVWVYPFDEYHAMTFATPPRLEEPFFGDWFMRAALNNGLPVNTVVSSKNLLASLGPRPGLYRESVLVSTVPDAGSALAKALLAHVQSGGRALLYGPLSHAGEEMLAALNLQLAAPITGQLQLDVRIPMDRLAHGAYPDRIQHREAMSAGPCREVLRDSADRDTQVAAVVAKDKDQRIAALVRRPPQWNGGTLAWVRGTNSSSYKGGHLLTPDDPKQWFQGAGLMRFVLGAVGYQITASKRVPEQPAPIFAVARHAGGYFFSGYMPDTSVELRWLFPQGAPVLTGMDAALIDGQAAYHLPRAWHRECRVFVRQREGHIACREQVSEQIGIRRRLRLAGLDDATVCFYPEPDGKVTFQADPKPPLHDSPVLDAKLRDDCLGHYFRVEHVTGTLLISW